MDWSPADVTEMLREQIQRGDYAVGDPLPTLNELNDRYFPSATGPGVSRTAYAPLIAARMVEARQGRGGGHFVASAMPASMSTAFAVVADQLEEMGTLLDQVRSAEFWVVEFERLTQDAKSFGESLHPSRVSAEAFAVDLLTELGESAENARKTADLAGFTAADTRAGGYGVRIYPYTLGGDRPTYIPSLSQPRPSSKGRGGADER